MSPLGLRHALVPSLLLIPCSATGQGLRGTVASAETGLPIGYSIVTLYPNVGSQFTDLGGAFAFVDTHGGTYILSVRQIGYVPLDTQIVIPSDSGLTLHIALRRLAIELPPVTIAATPCETPGPPPEADTALLAVFGQLQENARRQALLADAFPFHYTLEYSDRMVNQRGDTGKPQTRNIRFSSSDNHAYQVGRVVEPAFGPWGDPATTFVIHSAELQDLGNPDFIRNHCFRLAGRDTIAGDTLVRVDWEPDIRIATADMAGSAYLDPATYELRYTATSLTQPERSPLSDVRSMTFQTRFRNIAPGVPLQDSLTAITTYRWSGRRSKVNTQRTLDVQFRRTPPDATSLIKRQPAQ
jgi:hypothetical protein